MIHNGRPQQPSVEGEIPVPLMTAVPSMPFFDIEGPLDWLDSSLPTSFGIIAANRQGRDIWDMFDPIDQ